MLDRISELQQANGELWQRQDEKLNRLLQAREEALKRIPRHQQRSYTQIQSAPNDAPAVEVTFASLAHRGRHVDVVAEVRRQHAVVNKRVSDAERELHMRSQALKVERERVQAQWLKLHQEVISAKQSESVAGDSDAVLVQPALSPDSAVASVTHHGLGPEIAAVAGEAAALAVEREQVRQARAAIDRTFREAAQLDRIQAAGWEASLASSPDAEERCEAQMLKHLEVQELVFQARLECAELKEQERLHEARAAADMHARSIAQAGADQTLEWEARAYAASSARSSCRQELWKLAEEKEYAAESQLVQAELRHTEEMRAGALCRQDNFLRRAAAEVREQSMDGVLEAMEKAAVRTQHVQERFLEEQQLLTSWKAELDASRISRCSDARRSLEVQGLQQISCARNEFRAGMASMMNANAEKGRAWGEYVTALEAKLERDMASNALREADSACWRVEEPVARVLQRVTRVGSQCVDDAGGQQLAAAEHPHLASCEEAAALGLEATLEEVGEHQKAWTQKLASAKQSRDKAHSMARALAEFQENQQSQNASRLQSLMNKSAGLRQVTLALMQEHELPPPVTSSCGRAEVDNDHSVCSSPPPRYVPGGTYRSGGSPAQAAILASSPTEPHNGPCPMHKHTSRHMAAALAATASSTGGDDGPYEKQLLDRSPLQPAVEEPVASMPPVYSAALSKAEELGWQAVHPDGEPCAWTVLHWAASEDRADLCLRLLRALADPHQPDDQGWSALACARAAGRGEAWQVLENAASASRISVDVSCHDTETPRTTVPSPLPLTYRATPGLVAAPAAEADTAAAAAAAPEAASKAPLSADPRCSEDASHVPPAYAAAIAAIEQYGWDIVHGGQTEWTVLHWAASEGCVGLCERLLRCAADPLQPDNLGRTALDYASEAGKDTTISVLTSRVAPHTANNRLTSPHQAVDHHEATSVSSRQGEALARGIAMVSQHSQSLWPHHEGAYPMSVQLSTRNLDVA